MLMKEEPTGYYVYVHRDPKAKIPFYVGRGKGKRATSKDRGIAWQEMVDKLGGEYDIEYLKDGGYPLEQVVEDLEMHCEEIDDELENSEDDNEEIIKLAKKLHGFLKDSLKKFLKD